MNREGNLFDEIKKMRKSKPVVANCIDGESKEIPEHFAGIYKDLFNSVNDQDELFKVKTELQEMIGNCSLQDVDKIDHDKVKEAIFHLKDDKTDPCFKISSDCLKNAPDSMFEHLANMFKCFLIHGHISQVLLVSTLVPLLKDKMGNICTSKNYRSIALCSLILKTFDWLIILLFGTSLGLDDLQFAYQPNCSTTICSWIIIETIDYFINNGSEVFGCMMDMTKAFDLVKHSILFQKLMKQGLAPIFIRLLLVMYVLQSAKVRWNGNTSKEFTMRNGVKQGAVLSAILYCVYMNGLFEYMRENRTGC